jgi:hypothetical protein
MTTPLPEWFATDIDLRHNQLLNARAHNTSTAPPNPVKGQLWFDTETNVLKYFDGSSWTGGRTFYNTVVDDGTTKPQRSRLSFKSTAGIDAAVTDESTTDTSIVELAAKYGPVRANVIAGELPSDGSAATLSRSDHSHGAPPAAGSDVVMTSWWQYDKQLWTQLAAPATFLGDLPGQTVGGGWQIGTNGSAYWAGDPIPLAENGVYRNSARVSAVGTSGDLSMGWLCYDADHVLLGQVLCSNQVSIVPTQETGILVARNEVYNPSGELLGAATSGTQWHSNNIFGQGATATIDAKSTDRATTGTHSIKASWPNLGAGNTQSNCLTNPPVQVPPNTPVRLSARVFVPTGSPDVRLDIMFYTTGAPITEKNLWVYKELSWTTPNDGVTRGYYFGISTTTPSAGTSAYLDEVLFRVGPLAQSALPGGRTYFDGDTPSVPEATFVWDGTPHDSPSSFYTIEPSWEVVNGHIAVGDGVPPAAGDSTTVDEAVAPLTGTVFFRPFLACTAGQLIVDTHEVGRSPRDLRVLDGLETGWVTSEGQVEAPNMVTADLAPPQTVPETLLRIGPVVDPPEQPGDVTARAYVDRALGLAQGESVVAPRFLWSSDPGVEPRPADLGFPFLSWPMFSQWLDTGMAQSRVTVLTGTWMGTGSSNPLVAQPAGTWKPVSNSHRVVTTVPANGVLLAISHGSAYATYGDYLLLRAALWSGVDEDGLGGAYVGWSGETIVSGSSTDTAFPRMPYTTFSVASVTAGTRYMGRTEYSHGGPSALLTRERTILLYLPDAARLGVS